jgi:branched-chain amino acid transport system permease protein
MIIEPLVLRRLYGRPLDTILATWGLSLIIIQLITLYFGRGAQAVKSVSLGSTDVLGTPYSIYRLLLILFAVMLMLTLAVVLQRTRLGLIGRAVIMNEELAQTMGLNTRRVRFVSFALGSGIAGLTGALLVPLSSVDPNLGIPWLIDAFLISLLVGLSTLALAAASLVFGTSQVLVGEYLNAILATLVVPLLAVVVLRVRRAGFVRRT